MSGSTGAARRRAARAIAGFAALNAAILWLGIARAAPQKNLLLNPDFTKGSGDSPDDWRTEGWIEKPTTTTYEWHHAEAGKPAELVVNSTEANDARWMQSMTLEEGWYYMSAEVRSENVGAKETGATISVLEDGISSEDLKGTAAWKKVGFYVKIGPHGADIDVALRVGGYSSLNTGRGFFRNPSVVKIDAPPPGAERVFDLDKIRKESVTPPIGRPWTLIAAFIVLFISATVGWRVFGETPVEASSAPPRARPQPTRAERRRARR
jgi:hypothetical protein